MLCAILPASHASTTCYIHKLPWRGRLLEIVVISKSTNEERQKENLNISLATLRVWRILMQTNLAPDIGERRRVDQSLDKNERIMKGNTHGRVLGWTYEQRGW